MVNKIEEKLKGSVDKNDGKYRFKKEKRRKILGEGECDNDSEEGEEGKGR